MSIPKRQLGRNGPLVSAIGYGAMVLSHGYGSVGSDEQRFSVLDRALELGATFWDSSDAYADNEDLLGAWFKKTGKRDQIFLCTKFGVGFANGKPYIRSDAEYVREACNRSLKRLGVQTIDLWYCHRVDKKTPIEETVGAMAEMVKTGNVKYLGLSEISAKTLRRAHKVFPISAVQVEYSPFAMDIEDPKIDLLNTCRELGIAVVAYSPLGRGILTGQIKSPNDFEDTDFRKHAPRYSQVNFAKNLELVRGLETAATKHGCTPGQLTLAWLLAQGDDIIPIPGTKRIKYLEENVAAKDVLLTAAEIKSIREEVEKCEIVGDRFPPAFEGYSFADTPELREDKC